MDSEIHIYAELLPNIRHVTVAVSLPPSSPWSSSSSAVRIVDGGQAVSVEHGGQTRTLRLPARVRTAAGVSSDGKLPLPPSPSSSSATWRLPVADAVGDHRAGVVGNGQTAAAGRRLMRHEVRVPWEAREMAPGAEVRCRACRAAVVPPGRVPDWRDLPSENWAEMMEFWHCHKPPSSPASGTGAGPPADEGRLALRGYGAGSSGISVREGVGFVDLVSFWFAEGDCVGLTFSKSSFDAGSPDRVATPDDTSLRSLNVFCTSCRLQIGYFNLRASAVTMYKWRVLCQASTSSVPGISECVSAALISVAARSGSATCLVMPFAEEAPVANGAGAGSSAGSRVLYVWLLNNMVRYTTTRTESAKPAVKLLWRLVGRAEADSILDKVTSGVQDISLPSDAIEQVIRALQESNTLLPPTERLFKEWKVGLLERCDESG